MSRVQFPAMLLQVLTPSLQALKTNNLPHLLFYGPPGTGKTSTGAIFCAQCDFCIFATSHTIHYIQCLFPTIDLHALRYVHELSPLLSPLLLH